MLRIREATQDRTVTLFVEGRLAGPWVEELGAVIEAWLARGSSVRLDASEVTFADSDGVKLLRGLRARDVALVRASRFLLELLSGDGR
jgi:anti-anti-sigma regulatory factor